MSVSRRRPVPAASQTALSQTALSQTALSQTALSEAGPTLWDG